MRKKIMKPTQLSYLFHFKSFLDFEEPQPKPSAHSKEREREIAKCGKVCKEQLINVNKSHMTRVLMSYVWSWKALYEYLELPI